MSEEIKHKILEAFGEVSTLFMTQDCKGTEIVMPTEELNKIAEKLFVKLNLKEDGGPQPTR